MNVNPSQHAWSAEALFSKALLFVEEMRRFTPSANDWQYALWSSLSLEVIARAAVANISPTLLAESKNEGWRNIYHALGHDTTAMGLAHTSIGTRQVLSILKELLPEFTKELFDFCVAHTTRRNAELHSGEAAFEKIGNAEWLPKFFASGDVLLRAQGKTIEDVFEDPDSAKEMIRSLGDEAAKAVDRDIKLHKARWAKTPPDEQATSQAAATAWATKAAGHRVTCPACNCQSLVRGATQGAVTTEYGDEVIVQRQTMLPATFECSACGLKISGYSKLLACGLGDTYTATERFSPSEFYGLRTDEEVEAARYEGPQWEEDHNE